jgi:hypothetical protein
MKPVGRVERLEDGSIEVASERCGRGEAALEAKRNRSATVGQKRWFALA